VLFSPQFDHALREPAAGEGGQFMNASVTQQANGHLASLSGSIPDGGDAHEHGPPATTTDATVAVAGKNGVPLAAKSSS
jgi:hypothetical protein